MAERTPSPVEMVTLQTNQGGNFFAGASNFVVETQYNTETVVNNITNIIHKEFDMLQELRELTEATHVRNRTEAPPDSQCLPGTRKKLIKQIQSWVNSGMLLKGVPSHVMWLYGYVGCGKSAIAQTIADKFAKKNRLAASFFFFRSTGDRSKAVRFPTTMASQVAKTVPLTKFFVENAWKTYRSTLASTPVHVQFLHLFLNPFHSALRSPGRMAQSHLLGPYLTVIDGLDECEDRKDIASLIDQINDFFKDNPRFPLRFFISSRVEEHIRHRLHPDNVQLIDLVEQTTEEEIVYILDEIFKNAAGHDRVVQSYGNWPSPGERRQLVQYADRSLLLLSTLTKFILESTHDGRTPKERLATALDNKLGLDEIYAEVLSRSEKYRHFDLIISTLALCRSQHSISGLARLLDIDQGDVILVLQDLHAIFNVPGDEYSPVTFSHSSLREFLCSEERAKKYFASPTHHKFLAYRFYANMESVNNVPAKERINASGSLRYHWNMTISPYLSEPTRLKEELHAFLSHIRQSTSPAHYPYIHSKLATYALLDRDWLEKLLPRSRRQCYTEELVLRLTGTRPGSTGWLNLTVLIGALKEPLKIIESRLGPVDLVDEFSVLCEAGNAVASPTIPSLLSYHTYLTTTCMGNLFTRRAVAPLGEPSLRITLLPLQDEPIRGGLNRRVELLRHVSGYSFWSFSAHLANAFKHDPSFDRNSLLKESQHPMSSAPREEMTAFEFLLCPRDYHVSFDDPGEYLPLFKANFARASETIDAILSPQSVDSLASSDDWGFVYEPRQNNAGKFWAYGSHKDDYSVLNLWMGYTLLARCLMAKMEKTHDDSTCTLHQKYKDASERAGHSSM